MPNQSCLGIKCNLMVILMSKSIIVAISDVARFKGSNDVREFSTNAQLSTDSFCLTSFLKKTVSCHRKGKEIPAFALPPPNLSPVLTNDQIYRDVIGRGSFGKVISRNEEQSRERARNGSEGKPLEKRHTITSFCSFTKISQIYSYLR